MKRWLSTKTAVGFGWFLVVLGLLPLVGLSLWAYTHNSQPISERIRLQPGQVVSPYFRPELDGTYQVTLDWSEFPNPATQVDLDWRIVDRRNRVIDSGRYYGSPSGANIIQLGEYHPQRGVRQRIIVNVHQAVNGPDRDATLEIGIPEVGLDVAEGAYPLAVAWAAVMTIPGLLMLAGVWFWRKFLPGA